MNRLLPLLLTAVFVPALAHADGPVLLRWRLEVGEQVRLRSVQDKRITTTTAGKKVKQRKTRTVDLALRVLGAEEALGVYSCELTLERITERIRAKGRDVTLDSKESDPTRRPGGADLAGQPIRFRMTDRGEVLALQSIAGQPLHEAPPKVRAQVETVVGDGFVRGLFMNQLGTLPEEAVKARASWTSRTAMPIPGLGSAELSIKNTVKKIDGVTCTIAQKGKADLDGAGSLGAVEVTSWTQKCTVRFTKGQIVEAKGSSSLRTRFNLGGRSGTATVKSKLSLTRL